MRAVDSNESIFSLPDDETNDDNGQDQHQQRQQPQHRPTAILPEDLNRNNFWLHTCSFFLLSSIVTNTKSTTTTTTTGTNTNNPNNANPNNNASNRSSSGNSQATSSTTAAAAAAAAVTPTHTAQPRQRQNQPQQQYMSPMPNLAIMTTPSPSRTNPTPSPTATSDNNHDDTGSRSSKGSRLKATIMSVYDLPVREAPVHIEMRIAEEDSSSRSSTGSRRVLRTGPPIQRHKDRNSFKFSQDLIVDDMPLSKLYSATATFQVVYETYADAVSSGTNQPATYQASYRLNQLHMYETTWLILQLDDGGGDAQQQRQRQPPPSGQGQQQTSSSSSSEQGGTGNHDHIQPPPTIRLNLTLEGPYRTEVGALVSAAQAWFRFVDTCTGASRGAVQRLPRSIPPVLRIDPKWMIVPAVPLVGTMVVTAPVILGVFTVGLPFFVPFVVMGLIVLAIAGVIGLATYCSTSYGRAQLLDLYGPLLRSISHTQICQRVLYQTGPRPSPVQITRVAMPTEIWPKLVMSLLIDLIGSSSYLVPLAGEAFDISWAPIQTILIMAMYDRTSPNLKYISFVEEILPFTDIVPSATIGWLTEYGIPLLLNNSPSSTSTPPTTFSMAMTTTTTATTTITAARSKSE